VLAPPLAGIPGLVVLVLGMAAYLLVGRGPADA
jgi:hypothetical protein